MSVIVPTLEKICEVCKLPKNRNDDFGSHGGNDDYKDTYCKRCRRNQLRASRARGKCKGKPKLGKRNDYFWERKQKLYGEDKPITETELQELIIWLQHPEAWEDISESRTLSIKKVLRKQLMQMKYYSTWIAPGLKNRQLRDILSLWLRELRFR